MSKYKKELREFKEFKKSFKFEQLKIVEKNNVYKCDGVVIKDENGVVGESDKWVNVGYSLRGMYPKLLSNLYLLICFKVFFFFSLLNYFLCISFPFSLYFIYFF